MKWALPFVLLMLLLRPGVATGQYIVYADIDGVADKSPDTLFVVPGDTVDVTFRVTGNGQEDVWAVNIGICPPPSAALVHYSDSIGGNWTITPPVVYDDSCVVMEAIDSTFFDLRAVPILVGVARFVILDGFTGGVLAVDRFYSGILDTGFHDDFSSIDTTYATVLLSGPTVARASWSELKEAFR